MAMVYNPTELDLTVRLASRICDANPFGEYRIPKRTVTVLPEEVAAHACHEFLEHGVCRMTGGPEDIAAEKAANKLACQHALTTLRFARGATKFDKEADHSLPGTLAAQQVIEHGLSPEVTFHDGRSAAETQPVPAGKTDESKK
jgi:hypothetical protein